MGHCQLNSTVRVGLSLLLCLWLSGCTQESEPDNTGAQPQTGEHVRATLPDDANWPRPRSAQRRDERRTMVDHIRDAYGMNNPAVLAAMANVPRHWFVPQQQQRLVYFDGPLHIGYGQTISQPFIVALMTELLDLDADTKVLEIGTGSGYQAAVLTEFTPHVYTIEILEPLAREAQERLAKRGYSTVRVRSGDGYLGWPEHQPFDAIIVTCAPDHIPPALLEQLRPGGKMVIPVGGKFQTQELVLVSKDKEGKIFRKSVTPVRFVPMLREPANPSNE